MRPIRILVVALALAQPGQALAQDPGTLTPKALPPLADPNFDHTVVLMLEHGDEGALGIVLNRPSETNLDDVLPEWRPFASSPSHSCT